MGQMKVYCESDPLAKNVSVARLTFSNLLACVKNACKRRCAYIISSKKMHLIELESRGTMDAYEKVPRPRITGLIDRPP
jgi:hypothetical protein